MEYVTLGPDGPLVSRLAFGCEPLGGADWGHVDLGAADRAVREAVESGITLFDTADVYGLGQSEERLSSALGADRTRVAIATKGGVAWRPPVDGRRAEIQRDISPASLTRAVEGSLRRLRVDTITLYQIHWPDGRTAVEDAVAALVRCVEAGKIRFIGCSNFSVGELESALRVSPLASAQVPFSLIDQRSRPVIDAARDRGVGVLAYGCLAQGLLSGRYPPGTTFPGNDRRSRLSHFAGTQPQVVSEVRAFAERTGRTPSQVALRWVLDAGGVSAVVAGIKTVDQLRENLDIFGWAPTAAAFDPPAVTTPGDGAGQ